VQCRTGGRARGDESAVACRLLRKDVPWPYNAAHAQQAILYAALDKTFFFDLLETVWGSPMTETARNV
jgi:hypothetical protein